MQIKSKSSQIQIEIKSKSDFNKILGNPKEILGNPRILGSPRTSFVVPRTASANGGESRECRAPREAVCSGILCPSSPWHPLEAERSGARLALGATKEVLGCIIDFLAFNWDFLGSSYYCIRIS